MFQESVARSGLFKITELASGRGERFKPGTPRACNKACLKRWFHSHFLVLMQKYNLIYMLNIMKRPRSSCIAVMTDPDLFVGFMCLAFSVHSCLSNCATQNQHFDRVQHIIRCTRESPQRSDWVLKHSTCNDFCFKITAVHAYVSQLQPHVWTTGNCVVVLPSWPLSCIWDTWWDRGQGQNRAPVLSMKGYVPFGSYDTILIWHSAYKLQSIQ